MPVFKTHKTLEIARGVKCFVRLEFGITRGQVPQDDAQVPRQVQQLKRHRKNAREVLSQTKEGPFKRQARAARSKTTREKPDGIVYDGVLLPPPNLRPTRRGRMGEKVYFEATRREVDWMVDNLGLSPTSSLLDLGCGSGRIPLGILDRVGEIREYRGVDVDKRFLGWARRHITPEHPNFQFIHLDAKNDYYNPGGEKMGRDFTLPFAKDEFDIICLFSVFTHMLVDDVQIYLKEFYRLLHPAGKLFMTANLEDGVPDVTNNPVGYRGRHEYKRPLATVRYNREFFEGLLDDSGFRVERYDPELRKAQRCLIVSKKPS
jgi:SAM-dependent methyltransferase